MGARLGRYKVLKHLATGGMADVLLGRSDGIEGFERHVVLKRIRPENARDQRFIRMFLDEARVAANLHHQHIVQVHDVGEAAGEYFIAMEYLHGEDLRTILSAASQAHQHVPLGHALAIVSAVAAGLHYAHERRGPDKRPLGIVHRDISPSNIFVGYDGSVKIVDFGIAKAAMRQETRTGSLKGKVSYMSPEQCKCGEVDRRSDVYALGVVLYEIATTTRLFQGDNDYLVMDQIVNGRVAQPRTRRPELPNELSVIIMRALATEPDRRYATADELRLAIEQFANHFKLTASTSSIAAYMRKQFGEKPEPWLEMRRRGDTVPPGNLAAGTLEPGVGWPEPSTSGVHVVRGSGPIAPAAALVGDVAPAHGADPSGDGAAAAPPANAWRTIMRRPTKPPPMELAPASQPRTDSKMGWESQRLPPAPRRFPVVKLAVIGAPLLAIAGFALWWFTMADESSGAVAAAAQPAPAPAAVGRPSAPAPAPVPSSAPPSAPSTAAPGATTEGGGSRGLATEPATGPAIEPATGPVIDPAIEMTNEPANEPVPAPANEASKRSRKPGTTKAVEPEPAFERAAPATLPSAAPAAPAAASPPAASSAPPARATPAAPLSRAVVDRAAAEHARELAQCDGGQDLHGEVTVRFTLDADGNVAKAQLTYELGKPRVANCILRQVETWHFAGQAAGAQGAYTVSFQ